MRTIPIKFDVITSSFETREGGCVVSLSSEDIREIAHFVRTEAKDGGITDMPIPIYNRFYAAASAAAAEMMRDEKDYFLTLQPYLPATLLYCINAEAIPSIAWEEILSYHKVASIDELWKAEGVVRRARDFSKKEKKVVLLDDDDDTGSGMSMKTLAFMQPWATLVACGIKDVELRNSMKTKCRKIFVAASGKKVSWWDLPVFVRTEYKKYHAKGILPSYGDLPQKCIIGHVDIVDVTYKSHGSPWEEGHEGIRYVLRNAHLLDEPIYGKNKPTPYFYNVEGYDEEHLPPSHVAILD